MTKIITVSLQTLSSFCEAPEFSKHHIVMTEVNDLGIK